jgi:DNA-directed RNA polymerase subunit beta
MIAEGTTRTIRNFSKVGDTVPIPDLIEIQTKSYARFLQEHTDPNERTDSGLEGLLREVFPIESYDGDMRLEYMSYELGKPRYTPAECRELRLTFGMPFRIRVRMHRKDRDEIQEDLIYLGELPIMIGGGEFIINGAERVIVSQLHRSPGVDFVKDQAEGDRALHACRIIPERGSWIEINVTKKDVLAVRIDQSSKIAATTFVRAMSPEFGSDEAIVKAFHKTKAVKLGSLKPEMYSVSTIVDEESGEEIVRAGCQIGDAVARLQTLDLKQLQVISNVSDPLILNTLAEDGARTHEEALLKIYARLRPGNPPQLEKARKLFEEKFYDENRYRLGKVGRFRLNRKLDIKTSDDVMTLMVDDLISCLKYLLLLRTGEAQFEVDDIDHLGNRRLRTIDELATEELRKGFLKLRRTVTERMSLRNPDELSRIAELINSKSISSAIEFFFGRGELSQVVDQTNPLSQLTHERRLSALGPGGLNRKRAGFEVRDVHISHYGRICPIETPEGTNIGLIASLAIYSTVDDYGFLITPYRKVARKGASVEQKGTFLRADEEMREILAPPEAMSGGDAKLKEGPTVVRAYGDLTQTDSTDVTFVDISPKQTVGVSASLIPFLEHDDANRALMGSNMQRQAVPLLRVDPPVVATGMELSVAANSGMVVRSLSDGTVTCVDAERIVINDTEEHLLRKFEGLNERTCLNQKPIVVKGQKVAAGEIIADGPATRQGELALGKNALVGFMTFDGYNFEDAIVISERLVKDDVFTSIHIDSFDVEIRETKLGREEFTADIPNVSERALRNLDEHGVVRVGTAVGPGDILVGKVCPKSKTELSPEEKLLHAIFGRAGEDVKNDSLEVPSGAGGVVIGTRRFSRRMHQTDEQKKQLEAEVAEYRVQTNDKICKLFRQMCGEVESIAGEPMVDPSTRQKVGHSDITEVLLEQIEAITEQWRAGDLKWVRKVTDDQKALDVVHRYWPRIGELLEEQERKIAQMKRGDELPSGVLEMVKVYIATKRRLSAGDKMAGRHGNKGVIARVVPEEDMPFLEDGTPLDILLNPLGVPSRMNVGQILETHLGWAASILGVQAVTPVFDGAKENEVHELLAEANDYVAQRGADTAAVQQAGATREVFAHMPRGGKITVYDGRSGEPFDQRVTVGRMYMLKLDHLVDDKIHARATGPYSLITQQPLGGKARTGGQRFGEMEVWGLEAYGAAFMLQELLTVKSDDVEGRTKIYESMVRGKNTLEAGTPVSFDVLCNEIRGLGLNIQLEKKRII